MAAQNPTIFGVGLLGRSPAVSAQQRVNCYVEIDPQGDRSRYTLHGLPGLTVFSTIGDTPIRGFTSLGPYMYVVHRDTLYQVRNDGVITSKGTLLTTEGRVMFTNNSDYLMMVDGTDGYTYRESTDTFATISDGDFPANPVTCTFLQGYFIVSSSGTEQFDISALDDPTSWPGDFDLAYADPDVLVLAFSLQGLLVLLGGNSMEYWGYVGAADFPFSRVTASQYGWGLEARYSAVMINSRGFALLRRREGGLAVCQFGGEPQSVTPPDLCALFDAYDKAGVVISAVGSGFSIAGHPFYQIHFPDIGATWLYDVSTGIWCQRKSYGLNHYRGVECIEHFGINYWTDYDTGVIWKQSEPTTRSDNSIDWSSVVWIEGQDADGNDRPVEFEVTGEHIHAAGNRGVTIHSLEIGMETGLGTQTGQGVAPKIMLQLSGDRGHSFGTELQGDIGAVGEYNTRVRWHRLGQWRDVVVRLRITDPVPRVITDEALNLIQARH